MLCSIRTLDAVMAFSMDPGLRRDDTAFVKTSGVNTLSPQGRGKQIEFATK